MKEAILSKLECFNDSKFIFDSKKHKYTYEGITFQSVTQYLNNFKPKFDSEYWSKKKADEKEVYQSEILLEWKKLNDYANDVGSFTHQYIENYFNKIYQEIPNNADKIDRINKFNKIFGTHLYKLDPIKFEVRIFSKKWKLAGTIDSIFLYKGKIFILDYKTNKHNFDSQKIFNNLLEPFEDFEHNHINEYSLQISLYSLILEEWGFEVTGGYLLHIGPNTDANIYKVVDMREKLRKHLDNAIS